MLITAPSLLSHNATSNPVPPAQLWIGNHDSLVDTTMEFLQKQLCKNNGCSTCTTCHKIRQQQHYAVMWLYPEKGYTLDQLNCIGSTLAFALESGDHYFFIIQKAEALTPTCANSLLKSIEEPPPGYHFILLTDRPNTILPTIRSRCIEQSWHGEQHTSNHPLFSLFATTTYINPAAFLKELEQAKINEHESVQLLDQLLIHWINTAKTALSANKTDAYLVAQSVIAQLKKAIIMPPMPGSSNLLWKDLFLRIKQ